VGDASIDSTIGNCRSKRRNAGNDDMASFNLAIAVFCGSSHTQADDFFNKLQSGRVSPASFDKTEIHLGKELKIRNFK
jgi:hypothetical protein